MPWINRTSTLPVPLFGGGVFTERHVYTAGYGTVQASGGSPSPPTTPAARICTFDHSTNGDATVGLTWTGTCPVLGAGQADVAWPGTFNQYLQATLNNSKSDSLPFTPTSYTVTTQKTAMRFTVDTTSADFAALIAADVGSAPAAYEVFTVTANLTFTHDTGTAGSGWNGVVRVPAAGPQPQAHWIKTAQLASYPVLATLAPGGDGAASLPLVQDASVTTSFRHELLAAVDAAETSGSDLGYTPVSRSANWAVWAASLDVTYRYLPAGVFPPLWQRQRIGVLDSPEQFASGLVTPQSSPWQGGTL